MTLPFQKEGEQTEGEDDQADPDRDDADDELGCAGGCEDGHEGAGEDEEGPDEEAETADEEQHRPHSLVTTWQASDRSWARSSGGRTASQSPST